MNTSEWLRWLVAIDTTSRNSNLQLIRGIEAWFKQHGIHSRLTYDQTQTKSNLLATLPTRDGGTQGGLMLSGHTDTVPVDGQPWETHPFEAVPVRDRIYGRGTADMKGFLAVILALVPTLKQWKLKYPVHFAFSYDEEIGCLGAPLLIDDMLQASLKPSACIVGEPTHMRPVVAHKGIQVFQCSVRGQAAHSSLTPQGCNAIDYAAKLTCYIRDLADQISQNGPHDNRFEVPFTTLSTNMIHGGIAVNTIPALCELSFEFRNLPRVKPESILDKIEKFVRENLQPRMRKELARCVA